MRRDMDLVRAILKCAAEASGPVDARTFVSDSHDFADIAYHIEMMRDAWLIRATVWRAWEVSIVSASVDSLTWEGNDFLDAVSSDGVWSRVKVKIAQITGTASFEVVKALAVKELSAILLQ